MRISEIRLDPPIPTARVVLEALRFFVRLISHDLLLIAHLTIAAFRRAKQVPMILYYVYCFAQASKIVRLDQEFDFDVIHAFWAYPAGFASTVASAVIGKAVAISVLGYDVDERTLNSATLMGISKIALNMADAVICGELNHQSAVLKLGVDRTRLYFFAGGVNTRRFCPETDGRGTRKKYAIGDDDLLVAFGPHLTKIYGADDFLKAAAIVSKKSPKVIFMLMGSGSRAELEELACKVSSRVIFTGKIPYHEMPLYYAAMDLYCTPCYLGQGISALEAMASGKPVVGYRSGQVKIIDGIDGLLVEPRNIDQLSETLLMLLNNPDMRHRMGKKARDRMISQCDIRLYAEQQLKAYQELGTSFRAFAKKGLMRRSYASSTVKALSPRFASRWLWAGLPASDLCGGV
jgi:glycosyltransferase involved in cell wall biosynthesis